MVVKVVLVEDIILVMMDGDSSVGLLSLVGKKEANKES